MKGWHVRQQTLGGTNDYTQAIEAEDDGELFGMMAGSPFTQYCRSCSTTFVLILVDQRGLPYPPLIQVDMIRFRKVKYCAQDHAPII